MGLKRGANKSQAYAYYLFIALNLRGFYQAPEVALRTEEVSQIMFGASNRRLGFGRGGSILGETLSDSFVKVLSGTLVTNESRTGFFLNWR
jgi:hypothetical protein